ncbi:hypothetical protein TNCV_2567571 [Trichonephila clavipes]|uniref:Uncharacterized protein n=1 Tax=Trichonephila clavipes TaxID=2585209 RepID=A0A8X7BMK3_TRICX|nr:hypothetical protein TNCV_2567571 [Trichonephila clavipes]
MTRWPALNPPLLQYCLTHSMSGRNCKGGGYPIGSCVRRRRERVKEANKKIFSRTRGPNGYDIGLLQRLQNAATNGVKFMRLLHFSINKELTGLEVLTDGQRFH